MKNENRPSRCRGMTRRTFLADTGMGFTGLALGALLFKDGVARANEISSPNDLPSGFPHSRPKAKSVIWIFMIGGVSHIESFDVKPALNRYGGKSIQETPFADVLDPQRVNKIIAGKEMLERKVFSRLMPLQTGYQQYGNSGLVVSDWFKNIGQCADDIAVVRSLWTNDNDHGAQLTFHTGRHVRDGALPTIGSWVNYGLGSMNDNLPEFVVMGEPSAPCCGGTWVHGSGYLGPEYAGVRIEVDPKKPLAFINPSDPTMSREEQEKNFSLLGRLNRMAGIEYPDDKFLQARIKSYELAFQMQTAIPDTLDLEKENDSTKKLYGLDKEETKTFGRQCLVARRLVERGVRFVQLYHGGSSSAGAWDSHAEIKANHTKLAGQVDQPIAGLLRDLKQRGMLEDTLVVWGTEFGRTPGAEFSNDTVGTGRDHHPHGFCGWLAGAGIKGGVVHGATDELGFHAVENRHFVTDLHATVMHLMGLNSRKLEVPGFKRLDMDHGEPIKEILA
ncbi:MAG: DUF1501 domain-containing protein [Verrucomicrobiota bacterium]